MTLKKLLLTAREREASDLHLTAGLPPLLRLNGRLVETELPALGNEDLLVIMKLILNSDQFSLFDKNGEVDLSYSARDLGMFRINCYRQQGSISIAIRMLNTAVPSLQELEMAEPVYALARKTRGLVLITGPTGSGKTTTMAAMVDLINSEKQAHVITLEDPIEYFHKRKKSMISQREIGRDSKSFPTALRAALRQDPDVILVGEMRDLETISIAVTAAETGHLVLATLHTSDSAQAVERIIDVFPANQQRQIRAQLANSLNGIIAQRLVRRQNGNGRIAALEIMICTAAVRNLVREGKIHQIPSMIQTGSRYGMLSMDKHLQALYDKGVISREESMEFARDEESMLNFLNNGQRPALR